MLKDFFEMTKNNAPLIIFIDEIGSIVTKRVDVQTDAYRKV